MSAPFEPTGREAKVANVVGALVIVVGVVGVVGSNVTKSWWPALAAVGAMVVAVAATTAWVAHGRGQGIWTTFASIARSTRTRS